MIKTIEMFQTADGQRFVTHDKAAEHVTDKVRDILYSHLNGVGNITASARFNVVRALVPNYEAAKVLSGQLASWFEG